MKSKEKNKKINAAHNDFMKKFMCDIDDNEFFENVFECGTCGNHVCKTKAELWGRVCPHCFGKLYRIS